MRGFFVFGCFIFVINLILLKIFIMDKIEMQDLVELNDEFFKTVTKLTKIKAPIAEVLYLEPEEVEIPII